MDKTTTPFGYMNAIMRIDLSTGSVKRQPLPFTLRKKYVGGMGLGARLLYETTTPGVDALGPDNPLIFATGPLTGTMAPAASRIDISFKSPVTGMFGTSNAGGFWGPELKYAGYDVLIVKGKAPHPVYLWIDDEKVETRDARDLWGQDTYDATDAIKKELSRSYGDQVRVIAIGPAGENLVKLASATVDYHHSASKCGVGAVFGSKNLKAVAVRGSRRVSLAEPQVFEDVVKECIQSTFGLEASGPSGADRDLHLQTGDLPGKNFQTGVVPHWPDLLWDMEKRIGERKRHACYVCDRACSGWKAKSGKYAGVFAAEIHSSAYRGWGATCHVDNLPAVYKYVNTCERLGMDYQGTAVVIGFAMELYQRGIIDRQATGGLELNWGDEDLVLELLHKIARREGFGDVLAESSLGAARRIGKGAEKYAMQIGGMSMGPHEPRIGPGPVNFDRSFFLGYLTSPRGGDNVKTTHLAPRYMTPHFVRYKDLGEKWREGLDEWVQEFVQNIDIPADIKLQIYGDPPRMEPHSYEGKAAAMVFFEDLTTAYNVLGLCFSRRLGPTFSARLLSACTGVPVDASDLLRLGHRVFALMWAYNGRERATLHNLDFPERFYTDPFPEGPAKGIVLCRDHVKKAMAEWYEIRGWDGQAGLPGRAALESLGLKDVADDLEKLGIVGSSTGAKRTAAKVRRGARGLARQAAD
ncbi:MAG: aldehyde ferredoxin oxidoreductase family protein [Chloroflexota bacterium]